MNIFVKQSHSHVACRVLEEESKRPSALDMLMPNLVAQTCSVVWICTPLFMLPKMADALKTFLLNTLWQPEDILGGTPTYVRTYCS